jgi:hypothetical protein
MGHFLNSEKHQQISFKENSLSFTPEARREGLYNGSPRAFCLPEECRSENLYVGIRSQAEDYFADHAIQWHRGTGKYPTNHLCSSQVCAVNFLFPFANHPNALVELLKPLYPAVKRALPIETTGEYVAFEWIGAENYLRERVGRGGNRTRGANCTSADAAAFIEHEDGLRHILLIEWKYTESYRSNSLALAASGTDRTAIYQHLLEDDGFVVRKDRLPGFEALFYEPFYQFFRQQSLAHKMEYSRELGADRVSLLHIAPAHNLDFREVTSPSLRPLGDTAIEVWKALLAQPDRFTSVSTESLFRPILAEKHPDLREWWDYVSERYTWLTDPWRALA